MPFVHPDDEEKWPYWDFTTGPNLISNPVDDRDREVNQSNIKYFERCKREVSEEEYQRLLKWQEETCWAQNFLMKLRDIK